MGTDFSDRSETFDGADHTSAPDDIELLRLAGRLARVGGWAVEIPSEAVYWSSGLFTLLGYESTGGAPPLEVALAMYPEREREIMHTAMRRNIDHGIPTDLESVIVDRHGSEIRVRVIGEPVRDATGAVVRIQGAMYDITEIVTERENRIEAQETLSRTLDYVPDFIYFIDESWRVTFANKATFEVAKLPAERLYSEPIWTLVPELASHALRPVYERAMTERLTGTAREYLQQYGSWLEVTAHPVQGGIAVFGRDVTADEERRQQIDDVSLHAVEQAALLDASSEAMIMEDLSNVVTYWNQGAEQIYGWTADEAVGRNIRELLYPQSTNFDAAAAELLRVGRWRGEMVQRTKDGRTVIVEGRWQAVLDDEGRPVKLFAVNSDVTAQRREQALTNRIQRMESLGTLASGIAHDLNNVLTPLLMSVQLMRSQHPEADREPLLEGMEVGIRRGADMIRQVLSFASGVEGVREVVTVSSVMHELATMTLHTLPKSIAVTTHLGDDLDIVGDQTQVLQVLVNLVANARDAMPHGGEMTISVHDDTIDDSDRPLTTLESGRYVVFTVEDSGTGMSREVLDKIFEPFFTTKELGKGTGLGLASSLAIVKSHGGMITAYSEPGVGSRFAMHLPRATESAVPEKRAIDTPPPARGSGELVLVVDDEPSIRQLTRLTLETHGYRVMEASNGRDAIGLFESHSDDVSLIVTDMMMPVMDGAATAAYFGEHHPHVAIIATSGINANAAVARASNSGVRHFVEKPFTTNTLLRAVHAALHQ